MNKLFVLLLLSLTGCLTLREGERTGVITWVTKSGLFCKTDEMRLSIGYTRNGQGTVSKEDYDCTIEDANLTVRAKRFMELGIPVKVSYRKEFVTFCRSESRDCFVTSIEEVK